MRLKIWGVRGSMPVPGGSTVRYGGNTPCIQIETEAPQGTPDRPYLIFDAGSGIRVLGNRIASEIPDGKPIEIYLLLTHVHWDHIQGLPFFKPLYRTGARIHLYGPDRPSLEVALKDQMSPERFPVAWTDVPSCVEFGELKDPPLRAGTVSVRHHYVNHGTQGAVVGYRADTEDGAVVFIPDNEPLDYTPGGPIGPKDSDAGDETNRLIEFVSGADVMLFDTMYAEEEYEDYRGWGHGTAEYAIHVAARAGVKRLGLFHYAPIRTDDDIDRMLVAARKQGNEMGVSVFASREGMILEIGAKGAARGRE